MLEVRLLGSFQIKHKKEPIVISSRPAQSLFAYLVLNAGTSHRREKLAGTFWPDSPEETARENLRHALWRMRKALPAKSKTEYLVVDDLSIAFNASAEYWLDASALANVDEDASSDELMTVLASYRGELLPGFYDDWVVLEREHLSSIFEHHMARLVSLFQNEKRWLDVLDWAERWIKLGQKPEPAYRALMSAHAAKGDMSKVAATYERCIKSLKEFDVEPSEQTQRLFKDLKDGKQTLQTVSIAPAKEKRVESHKSNLPVPITSFIGREKEVEQVVFSVERNRLVTLTGPGGVGKTRLAIQSSTRLLTKFKDGVWWVELAPLIDDALVPQAIAQALGVRESPVQPLIESLKTFLREKRLLLVLDNCEHLIRGSSQCIFELLSHCTNLRVMTTSREALEITGEVLYPVPTLSFPRIKSPTLTNLLLEYESIRLFVERACAVKPDFVLTAQNAAAVLQICERLDGISLAIELAATRTKMMSVEEIAEHLNDRFNLLTRGSRTALPRHQTLRAAIDWSYKLLTEPEQILFRRLAIFVGGFSLDAVESVAAGEIISKTQVADLLEQLIDKSLVIASTAGSESETRYSMLETIREYAREKLEEAGEKDQLRQRHCSYFIVWAEQIEPKLKGSEQFEWLNCLEVEHDNLRTAWECAIENDIALASRLIPPMFIFWIMVGNLSEGRKWLPELIQRTDGWQLLAERPRILSVAGWLASYQYDLKVARALQEEAVAIARNLGDKGELAFTLLGLGSVAHRQRDEEIARTYILEALGLYEEIKDQWSLAWALLELPAINDYSAKAEEIFLQSLAIFQELGDKFRAGRVLNMLGELMRLRGDYDQAAKFYEEDFEILKKARNRVALLDPTFNLAWVLLNQGNYLRAQALFEDSMQLFKEDADTNGMIICIGGFAGLLCMTAKPKQAAKLFGVVEGLLESVGMIGRMDTAEQKELDHYIAAVRRLLDKDIFAKAWEEGRTMTLEQAIEFAFNETKELKG